MTQKPDAVALTALVCGLAPLGLALVAVAGLVLGGVAFALLVLSLSALAAPAAVGFGVAGVLRAQRHARSAAVPATGLVLGLLWLGLVLGLLGWFFLGGGGMGLAGSIH